MRRGQTVIAGSVNPIEITRTTFRNVATEAGGSFIEVEVVCSDVTDIDIASRGNHAFMHEPATREGARGEVGGARLIFPGGSVFPPWGRPLSVGCAPRGNVRHPDRLPIIFQGPQRL